MRCTRPQETQGSAVRLRDSIYAPEELNYLMVPELMTIYGKGRVSRMHKSSHCWIDLTDCISMHKPTDGFNKLVNMVD